MYYPEELVEEIRAKNDIVDVISGYLKMQKKGGNHWACCPFHSEKTPSFSVSGNKQMFHCFGCGVSGNVYTFIMKYENYSFPEAVKMLADRAGVQLPEEEYSEEARKRESKRARLLEVNKEAARYFYYQLRDPRGRIGYEYLKKRELSDETMHKFGLGYAGKNGAELVRYLRSRGFEDEIIKEAGLATHSEKWGLMSQFWNRVMYPIQDGNHRVIGFGGRVMGEGEPKYLNSPETPIFDKRRNLYGLNFARTAKSGNMILCEGYMDVIAMHQAGFTQAVASLGTAFTPEQANLLRRYTDSVLLAYDSDGAGVKAALRGIGILREAGLAGKVIDMRPYKDPDEFMKALGREAFEERIARAENSFFFEIRILEGQFDMNDPESKTRFHREIARKLCEFTEDVERDNYLQAVADKYFIGIGNLRKLVTSYASQTGLAKPIERPRSGVQQKNKPEESARRSQRLLITWVTDEPALYDKIRKYITAEDFTEDLYRRVAERLFGELERGEYNPAGIISMFEDEEEQREAAALFHTNLPELTTGQERAKAFHDIVLAVKKNSYEYYTAKLGTDVSALNQVIEGKKALEELARTHISPD
ncbi:MAG: DNA primase [Lachnospiraceae bacterium]|nr:DNA primase [Butyrivibrio sp.]MCM1343518.1 DNA primase [Muribaculaceae bacterium]MCM1409072.1 DNA primase [Lachnospiraceae bacterium]